MRSEKRALGSGVLATRHEEMVEVFDISTRGFIRAVPAALEVSASSTSTSHWAPSFRSDQL